MTKAKSRPTAQRPKPWWSKRRNRNNVLMGLFGTLVVAIIALFVWFATQGMGSPKAPEAGRPVEAFQLPDVVSGKTFSMADYIGEKDIVIVSYMGFF